MACSCGSGRARPVAAVLVRLELSRARHSKLSRWGGFVSHPHIAAHSRDAHIAQERVGFGGPLLGLGGQKIHHHLQKRFSRSPFHTRPEGSGGVASGTFRTGVGGSRRPALQPRGPTTLPSVLNPSLRQVFCVFFLIFFKKKIKNLTSDTSETLLEKRECLHVRLFCVWLQIGLSGFNHLN